MATKPIGQQKAAQKQGEGKAKENNQPWQSLVEPFKDMYYLLEDRYYSLLDYLEDERGIPVYEKFVEPVETRSIPSFPVAIVSTLVLLAALFGVASLALAPNTATVAISLVSTDGGPVSEANVTLFVDNAETGARIASKTSNYSGVAVFEKVPMGVSLFVTVVAPDYKDYLQPLAPLSRDAPFAQLELESVSSSQASFKVLVRDESNLPVLGATVTARTVTGTLLVDGVQLSNALGAAQFALSKREFLAIDVEKEGYESVYGRVVDATRFLSETVKLSKKTNAFTARSVKVIAVASNSTGGAVSAEVELNTVAGSELGKKRTQDGRASFDVPQGTEFYISATATSNDTAKYFEYYSGRLVAEDDVNEFTLEFISKAEANSTNSTCGVLLVYVQNESKTPLSGEVSLYLESTNAFVARRQAQSGSAAFDLCANSTLYAAAYSQGYFAANALGLRPGTNAMITLRTITPANNGSAEITALDADAKTPVSGAIVSILGSDNRFLAYPKQSTNADGRALFFGLELGASYVAFADKPSKNAKSALFSIPEGAGAKVTIVFGHSVARIAVAPVDVLTGESVNAVATAKATGMPASSCSVRTSNTTFCELTVYSGIPVTVEVTSSGYEKLVSSPFVLSESESVRYAASMFPSSLKNQFTVKYLGLFDSKGGSVSSVERGGQYDAKFIVNIPTNASAYKAGFILRIGTAGFDNRSALDPLEHFVIIPKQYPQVPVNLMSYSYKPSASCTLDIRNSSNEQGYYKWAYFLLDNASGVREVVARVLSKDNAYTDEKLRVSSSAWYSPSGAVDSYLHVPVDSDFGSANRSSTRDWCYAKSDYKDYPVRAGQSYCGTSACASMGFYDSDSNRTSKYKGIIGRPFFVEASFELLRAVANPRIVLFSASQKARIHQYNVSTDTQNLSGDAGAKTGVEFNLTRFYSDALVTLNVTFSDKADFSAFYADLYDGSTRLSRAYGYVTEGGFGKLRIYAAPERMAAAGSYAFNITLGDYYSSSPVEDALITLNETLGTTFSGRRYSVLGGSIIDPMQGVSGIYRMNVTASQKGAFDIVATHPDYIDARKQIIVDGVDFLSTDTSDIEACGEANPVNIYNSHVLDANVSITASKAGCITVTGFSQVRNATGAPWTDNTSQVIQSGLSYFLPLSYQSQGRITISPASWGKACSVTIAASARDGSMSTRTFAYSNCAESAFSEFLSVSPSRVSYTSSNGKCNRAAVVNVSSTLPAPGTVSVQLSAPGILVETGGSNQSLSTPFIFSVERGGKISLVLYPMAANSTVMMTFNATDGSRNANVSIPFDNCPAPTREAAPEILSYSPKDYARITTDSVTAVATVDTSAYCRIGPSNVAAKQLPYLLSQKSSAGGNYDYGVELEYNKGSGTPFVFGTGRNTAYVGCCNPASKGGECTTENVPISFDFQYVVPTSTPRPSPSPLPSPTPACLTADTACTDYSKCCSAICNNGKCLTCNPQKPSESGATYKGCTSSAPLCNSSYVCVQCTDTDKSFCKAGEVCIKSACKPGCLADSDCDSKSKCDLASNTCVPIPATTSKILTYVPSENAFFVDGVKLSPASVSVKVSSVLPVSGFILAIDNTKGIGDGNVAFTTDSGQLGIYTLAGSAVITTITVAKGKIEHFLVTYPDMNPAVMNSNSWGYGAGYLQGKSGKLSFSALPATLLVMASFDSKSTTVPLSVVPEVVNTDDYTFSGGVFETTKNVFVPYDPGDVASFDKYYKSPTQGESYTGFLFNNVMLSSDYGLGLAQASLATAPDKVIAPGYNGINNLGAVGPSGLDSIFTVWPVHKGTGLTTHQSNKLQLSRAGFATSAGVSSGASKLNEATSDVFRLVDAYKKIGQSAISTGAISKALRIAYDGKFPDAFLAVEQGAIMHVIWLPFDAATRYYKASRDITPSFEYPQSLPIEAAISKLASPYQKYILAYPGQKRNMAYYCPYPDGVCNTLENSVDKGEYYREGTSEEKAALPALSASLKVYTGGAGQNPQLTCPVSKVSRNGQCLAAGSSDACVITASNEWFYIKSDGSRAYGAGECDNSDCTDCFGHGCDATHFEYSNFNGGTSGSSGFDPYALVNPEARCVTYRYTRYFEGECICVRQVCTPFGCTCVCSSQIWNSESKTEYLSCGTCDATSGPNSFPSTQNAVEDDNRLKPAFTDRGGSSCTPVSCQCPDTCPGSPAPMTSTFMNICYPQTICTAKTP